MADRTRLSREEKYARHSALMAALRRISYVDRSEYRRLLAVESSRLLAEHQATGKQLSPESTYAVAAYRTKRRMASTRPDLYTQFLAEERIRRGTTP